MTQIEIAELRREFATLRRNASTFVSTSEWMDVVAKIARKLANGSEPSPEQWVIAARKASTKCDRCSGTGHYHWGAVINGKPTHGGTCYHCEGSGRMNQDDYRRCYGHLMYQIRSAIA